MASTAKWRRVDSHDGVTLARCKFGRGSRGHAVIKVEGVLSADPATVYQFLQLTTREGGKVNIPLYMCVLSCACVYCHVRVILTCVYLSCMACL